MITVRELDMSSWQAARSGEMVESMQLAVAQRVLNLALDLEDEAELLYHPPAISADVP